MSKFLERCDPVLHDAVFHTDLPADACTRCTQCEQESLLTGAETWITEIEIPWITRPLSGREYKNSLCTQLQQPHGNHVGRSRETSQADCHRHSERASMGKAHVQQEVKHICHV